MSTSAPFALADARASYTTAPGSAPSECLITSAPLLSPHITICSIAAALNVSAAAMITFLPSSLSFSDNFPIVVVLPVPFTPIITITAGLAAGRFNEPSS